MEILILMIRLFLTVIIFFYFFSIRDLLFKFYFIGTAILIFLLNNIMLKGSIYYEYVYLLSSFLIISIEYFIFVKNSIFFNFKLVNFIKNYNYFSTPVYIIDSSCILDNRLSFLIKEKVLKGVFVIYDFVYEELKRIASKEEEKHALVSENFNKIEELRNKFPIFILKTNKNDFRGPVDDKLIYYTKKNNGILLTNDYELYQKAKMFVVDVIDINIIANNMKIMKVPGDKVTIKILKDGKEPDQGVGYLEDGTMVVVHQGKDYVGKTISVIIDSVIQTQAGRILFANINENNLEKS